MYGVLQILPQIVICVIFQHFTHGMILKMDQPMNCLTSEVSIW